MIQRVSMSIPIYIITVFLALLMLCCGGPKQSRDGRKYRYDLDKSGYKASGHIAPSAVHRPEGQVTKEFKPCSMGNQRTSAHAWAAAILTLQEREWVVDKMDFQRRAIMARVCHLTSPNLCAKFRIFARSNGNLLMENAAEIPPNIRDDLKRWLALFERNYSIARCYTNDTLNKELGKFGVQLPATPQAEPDPNAINEWEVSQ